MTTTNNPTSRPIDKNSLTRRVLVGAGIGLVLITVFLSLNRYSKPEWGEFWMIRPLIIVTLAGAGGGLGTYFMEY
ncbi:MAG: potassium transporter KefB, partial [Chitinophagaceae bacterium]